MCEECCLPRTLYKMCSSIGSGQPSLIFFSTCRTQSQSEPTTGWKTTAIRSSQEGGLPSSGSGNRFPKLRHGGCWKLPSREQEYPLRVREGAFAKGSQQWGETGSFSHSKNWNDLGNHGLCLLGTTGVASTHPGSPASQEVPWYGCSLKVRHKAGTQVLRLGGFTLVMQGPQSVC